MVGKAVFVVALCFFCICNDWMAVFADDTVSAECNIEKNSGIAPIYGKITLSQKATGGETTLTIHLEGFSQSASETNHGFHVHEFGNLSQSCNAAGAHFNPEHKEHGAPADTNRHIGDLGNVLASKSGVVHTTITDSKVSLVGTNSVLNKAIVVHETFDDLGLGGFNDSKTTGHAGKRFGCCLILQTTGSSGNRWSNGYSLIVVSLALLLSRLF